VLEADDDDGVGHGAVVVADQAAHVERVVGGDLAVGGEQRHRRRRGQNDAARALGGVVLVVGGDGGGDLDALAGAAEGAELVGFGAAVLHRQRRAAAAADG